MCNCNQQNTPCSPCQQTPCQPPIDCSCPVKDLSTNCSVYTGDDLTCSGIVSGLTLTEVIVALDAYICEAIDDINTAINLINVGTGRQIYAGIDALGRRKIRSLITTGNLLTSTQNTDDITFTIDEEALVDFIQDNQKTYSVANVGTGAEVYKDSTIVSDNTQFNLRTITSIDGSIKIREETNTIDLSVEASVFIEEGDNITITGGGNSTDPYVINSTDTITYVDGGISTTVEGDGSIGNPYQVNVDNLQKTISVFPYTLVDLDDKYSIFVNNGASNVVINVPDTLLDNFSCLFIQKGTGTVTITATGASTLFYPTSLTNVIKGRYYWALLEKDTTTTDYYLMGSLTPTP